MRTLPAMGKQPEKLALRPAEAAAALGVSRSTIYKWLAEGRLANVRLGGVRLIPVESVRGLLEGEGAEAGHGR